MQKNNYNVSRITVQIVVTALFLAIAVIIHFFNVIIPIMGVPAMRISFAGPFMKFPGLLFGPMIGGITGGMLDIIGFFLKPQGGYIPWLTVTSILSGCMTAFLWHRLKDIYIKRLEWIYCGILIGVILLGIVNYGIMMFFPNTWLGQLILAIGSKSVLVSVGLGFVGVVGFIFLVLSKVMGKAEQALDGSARFLKLIIAVGIPGIIVTTLNTFFLQMYITALADKAFILLWIPRVVEELFMIPFQSYILVILFRVYDKIKN